MLNKSFYNKIDLEVFFLSCWKCYQTWSLQSNIKKKLLSRTFGGRKWKYSSPKISRTNGSRKKLMTFLCFIFERGHFWLHDFLSLLVWYRQKCQKIWIFEVFGENFLGVEIPTQNFFEKQWNFLSYTVKLCSFTKSKLVFDSKELLYKYYCLRSECLL